MFLKLKKFLLFLARRKLFFFVLIIGGLVSPLYSVQAAFKWYYLTPLYWYIKGAGAITGWGTELVAIKLAAFIAALVTTILQIPLFLANVFLAIAAGLLDLATSPTFINLSYTKLDNPIIRMGWTVTRDLANMGIVLGLIVIGAATILRIESYQAKKTLPVLIIIALLINFTPVLLGIIVDASNIIMNFFLQGSLDTSGFMELMKNQWGTIIDSWKKAAGAETLADILAPLGKTVALTFYGFIAGFIFLVFAFIFIMRYIAIWILVILSPLAFVAYILPHTKKYFDQWWKQFLNWCFIGVWAAFFLYLSNGLLALATGQGLYGVQKLPIKTIAGEGGTPATTDLPGLLNDLLPYYVIIGFLVLGLVATLSISAYGTSTIIDFAKTKGKAATKGVPKWVARQTAGRFLASEGGKKLMERMKIPTIREAWVKRKKGEGTWLGVAGGVLATTTGVRWTLRGTKYAGLRYGAAQEKRIENEKKKLEEQFGEDYERAAISSDSIIPGNYHKKIAMARYMAEKKGGKGLDKLGEENLREAVESTATYSPGTLSDIVKHKQGLITDEKVGNIVKNTMVGKAPEKQMDDKDVKTLIKLGMTAAQAVEMAAFKKATDALKEKDVENLTDEIKNMPQFQEMTARFKGWGFINKIGVEKGLDWIEKIQNKAQEIGVSEVVRTNPSFIRAAYTPSGGMFLKPWKNTKGTEIKGKKELNEIIQTAPPLISDQEVERRGKEYIKTQERIKKERATPSDTGEARKKKRKEPDVGNP